MKNLAPQIFRQRLLIEGFYGTTVTRESIAEYFRTLTGALDLRAYGEPTIHSPAGVGKEENQGFDAFIPLIDSGIALYVWANAKFLSALIYTCKGFDAERAVEQTRAFFQMNEVESGSF